MISSGSIKYFILTCFIVYALKNAQLIWIDELDASLHTSLFSLIIKQFNDSKYNSSGSQMIFTTHNTVMLNRQLRRDQIMFVTKNKYGESFLKPMHSPDKPIRIGKSVESEYRDGDLGGVSEKVIESE
jgi:AAA15 family ATPase/GTPase